MGQNPAVGFLPDYDRDGRCRAQGRAGTTSRGGGGPQREMLRACVQAGRPQATPCRSSLDSGVRLRVAHRRRAGRRRVALIQGIARSTHGAG